MGRNLLIVAGAAAIVVAGAAIWFVWFASDVKAGPGPYGAELIECREYLSADLMYPDPQIYLEETVWHEETERGLLIGGKVQLLGGDGLLVVHNYQCLMRNRQVVLFEVI